MVPEQVITVGAKGLEPRCLPRAQLQLAHQSQRAIPPALDTGLDQVRMHRSITVTTTRLLADRSDLRLDLLVLLPTRRPALEPPAVVSAARDVQRLAQLF